MASFFRKRIANKVLSMLQKKQELRVPPNSNLISSLVKINRVKSSEPQLMLPWKLIEKVCDQNISVNPKELVRLLRNQGLPTAEGFTDITFSESPLSIIFTVDKHIFSKIVLLNIYNDEDNFIKNSCFFENIEKLNIVVQCSVPSIGEIFHFTHFRSAIHSNYVTNINEFVGHKVKKVALVNDWGLDAAIFLTGYESFKSKGNVPKIDFVHLSEVMKGALIQYKNDLKFKQNSDICFEKMQQGDISVISEWQKLRKIYLEYYDSVYKRIGIRFDGLHFDSSCFEKSKEISNQLLNSDIINRDIGVTSCDELNDNPYIKDMPKIDSALYDLSRYIGAATQMKDMYCFNKMYYVSPSSQQDFLLALFYFLKKLNYEWANELCHINLKLIGSFDSKRRKKININTTLDRVKDQFITELHENLNADLNESLEEMAENLSVASLIVNDMKHRRKIDYELDWKDIITFKKDTAASFQLCYAGLKGLQEDSEYRFNDDIDLSPLLEPGAHYLIQHLARFDEMVFKSYNLLEPCIIFQYLSSLWYFTDQVTNVIKLDIKTDRLIVIKARLLLLSATLKVLNKGLHLLGITPLEKIYSPEKPFVESS